MLTTKQFFKQGLQIGPWKVTRKVLAVVIGVCFVVLAFGGLMLETHAFDSDDDWRDDPFDDDNSHEIYDDDDDDDDGFFDEWSSSLGGGDMMMLILMAIALVVIVVSLLACFFAQVNPPSHLDSRDGSGNGGNEQVFTIQLTKPSIGPNHPQSLAHYQQYHLQQYEMQQQQYQQQLQQEQQQNHQAGHRANAPPGNPNPSASENRRRGAPASAHNRSMGVEQAQQLSRAPPPPYSPPTGAEAAAQASTAPEPYETKSGLPSNSNTQTSEAPYGNEKPPPYSP